MTDYVPVSSILSSGFSVSAPPKVVADGKYTLTMLQYDGKKPLFKLDITNGKIRERHPGKLRLLVDIYNEDEINGLIQSNKGVFKCIEQFKNKLKISRNFNAEMYVEDNHYMKAFHRPYNDNGEPIGIYQMLLRIGWQSIFQMPQSETEFKKIDPKTLLNKDITCSVIFSADRLESDNRGCPSLALIVNSCIVLDVRDLPSEHTVDDSVIEYIRNNKNKIARSNKLILPEVKEDLSEMYIPAIPIQADLPDIPPRICGDSFSLSSYLTPKFT